MIIIPILQRIRLNLAWRDLNLLIATQVGRGLQIGATIFKGTVAQLLEQC